MSRLSQAVCRNEIFHVFVSSQVTTHGFYIEKETNNVKKTSNGIKMLFLCFDKRLKVQTVKPTFYSTEFTVSNEYLATIIQLLKK